MDDFKLFVGHNDLYIPLSSGLSQCLLQFFFICIILGVIVKSDTVIDLISLLSHCGLYFTVPVLYFPQDKHNLNFRKTIIKWRFAGTGSVILSYSRTSMARTPLGL